MKIAIYINITIEANTLKYYKNNFKNIIKLLIGIFRF